MHDGKQMDKTRFVINEAATQGYDVSYDASKFFSTESGTAHLYTIEDNVSYAINERPTANGEILLGLQVGTKGTYTITLNVPKNSDIGTVTLIDRQQAIETDLTTAAYTFYADAGTQNKRFLIRLSGATGIQTVTAKSQQTEPQYFDLQGRRTSQPQKGIYVRDGHKIVIK